MASSRRMRAQSHIGSDRTLQIPLVQGKCVQNDWKLPGCVRKRVESEKWAWKRKKTPKKHENTKYIAKITENKLNCPNHTPELRGTSWNFVELRGGLKIYENLLKILGLSWFFGPRTSWNFVELRGTSCKRTFPLIFHVLGVFCQIAAWFTEIHCADVRFCWFSYLWTIFAKLELDSLESNVKTCIPNCFK